MSNKPSQTHHEDETVLSNMAVTEDPILVSNVQDVATARIRQLIVNRQLAPCEWLRPKELASMLGVSTTPIREALRRLQAEGLVEFLPRRGSRVAQLSVPEYEEVQAIRLALETLACRYIAENFTRIPIARLRDVLVRLEESETHRDTTRRVELVRQFFFTIFEASGKQHLVRILSGLWDALTNYVHYFSSLTDTVPTRMGYFRKIYAACEAQDSELLLKSIEGLNAWSTHMLSAILRQEQEKANLQ